MGPVCHSDLKLALIRMIPVPGEKFFSLEEILLIYSDVKKDKDQGVFEDFVECLKLYDKQEDGTMVGQELLNILLTLGEYEFIRIQKCTKRSADTYWLNFQDGPHIAKNFVLRSE